MGSHALSSLTTSFAARGGRVSTSIVYARMFQQAAAIRPMPVTDFRIELLNVATSVENTPPLDAARRYQSSRTDPAKRDAAVARSCHRPLPRSSEPEVSTGRQPVWV